MDKLLVFYMATLVLIVGAQERFVFKDVLANHLNSSYNDFEARLTKRNYLEKLSFNPEKTRYFDL